MSESDIIRIALEVSQEAADQLMRAFGGCMIYVPRDPGPGHEISRTVGHENALKIAQKLGPGPIRVPTGARAAGDSRKAEILRLLGQGMRQREIARKVGCSSQTVCRWQRWRRNNIG